MGQIIGITIPISTHAPHAECDDIPILRNPVLFDFNSRTPRGVRHQMTTIENGKYDFNSRTPRGVRRDQDVKVGFKSDFNSRTPRGVRPNKKNKK